MSLGVPPSVCPSVPHLSGTVQGNLLKFGSKVDAEEFGGDVHAVTSQGVQEHVSGRSVTVTL